ncbi:DUF6262 family protein [Streptomyces sp. NPDC056257]|uniref:DUF6262 family protein n=1 Tax=Streptomyces sp. NPDC056257 TaxID=3345765 RepID=UPI0035E09512
MNSTIPASRTAAANHARRARTQAKIQQVRTAISVLKLQGTTITVTALVRQAGVSRTFLYENPEARTIVTANINRDSHGGNRAVPAPRDSDGSRERALNAEAALKDAHGEIRTRRNRIAQLMGQIRDLETTSHRTQPSASPSRTQPSKTACVSWPRTTGHSKTASKPPAPTPAS